LLQPTLSGVAASGRAASATTRVTAIVFAAIYMYGWEHGVSSGAEIQYRLSIQVVCNLVCGYTFMPNFRKQLLKTY
jgi:hypothetical protein